SRTPDTGTPSPPAGRELAAVAGRTAGAAATRSADRRRSRSGGDRVARTPGRTRRSLSLRCRYATGGSCRASVLGALLERAAEAVGLGAGLDDVGAVGQPVQQRLAQPGVGNDLGPFRKRQVGGQQHRTLLGPLGD